MISPDLARCDGVGRMTIERRLAALVAAVGGMEARLRARVDNAVRSAETHPDPDARKAAIVRELAYLTALDDLRDLLSEVP